ncbi:accessory Sec system protein Asp2 [Bacillus cereus]|uniref:accessory Sec system protein Asp2 n=1 Tax=Bacillus cereus TaxID=1396 RepID=UPI000BFC7EA9|nr:Two component regulator three Y domain-containing protein [Bacillus cereus]
MGVKELIFKAEKNVKYIFERANSSNKSLIIVFSAFSPIGVDPKYNYIKTLNKIDCNKLFILDDFGCRASYYLCENKDYGIEKSVIKLIRQVIKEMGIEQVIACGSSKGGYAALYYGMKYGFNHIIAGSPQTLLGDYLLSNEQFTGDVAKFIAGGTNLADKDFLNNIIYDVIDESSYLPDVYIHVGKGEYHYNIHVKPLLKIFKEKNISYKLDLGNYSKHSDLVHFFPGFLQGKVHSCLESYQIKSLLPYF